METVINNLPESWTPATVVSGVYCSVPFSGTIVGCRFAPRGKRHIFTLQLDEAITVFGEQRTQIEILQAGYLLHSCALDEIYHSQASSSELGRHKERKR